MLNDFQKKLIIIKNVALEYRLSLKNICRFMSVEPTLENQRMIFKELCSVTYDPDYEVKLSFLVNETDGESEKDSNLAYNLANFFLQRYFVALKSGKKDLIEKSYNDLFQIDYRFKTLISEGISPNMTYEQFVIISKYRIKHVLSKTAIEEIYGIAVERLRRHEKRISDERLKEKIDYLNDYCYSVGFRRRKGYRS